jgi:hypothetical protein
MIITKRMIIVKVIMTMDLISIGFQIHAFDIDVVKVKENEPLLST